MYSGIRTTKMQYRFISKSGSRRLLLLFAGWGTDFRVFSRICRHGYDVMAVWDYRHFDIDWSCTAPYEEICIVAWSFGVYAAAMSTHALNAKVSKRIAVNGTTTPVDNRLGIPVRIFEGTLAGLSERSLYKFYRRMCGSRENFDRFAADMPERSVDELRDELKAIYPAPLLSNPLYGEWDLAIISRDDAIFPAVNQWRAWRGTPTVTAEGAHWFDFQNIIDRHIIDKQLVGTRFERGRATYDNDARAQQQTVADMVTRLHALLPDRTTARAAYRILEIGCGTGALTKEIRRLFPDSRLELWDIVNHPPLSGPDISFRCCDGEIQLLRTPDASFDMIVSASTVQWFNSQRRFLRQASRVLSAGGIMVFSTFLRGNLVEIERITRRGLPLMTLEQWLCIIPDSFEVIATADYRRDMVFDSAIDVFRHLKATGVNALGRPSDNGDTMTDILRRYTPDLDGKFHITYRPVIFLLRKIETKNGKTNRHQR